MELVAITIDEYRRLLRDSYTLEALEVGGVDNWTWYGDSLADVDIDAMVDEKINSMVEFTNEEG